MIIHPKKTMSLGLTDQNEQFIKIMFGSNDLDVLYKVLDIPGRKHVPVLEYWIIPINEVNFRHLQVLGFIGDQQLNDALEGIQNRVDTNVKHAITGLNGTLFPFQKTGVEFIEKSNGRALVADEMGLGKAQPIDAKVLTPSGWRPIGELQIGEKIFGPDGKKHYVVGIYPQGYKQIYKVEFSDGSSCECCKDHLWNVQTTNDRFRTNKFRTLSLNDIIKSGLLKYKTNSRWFIPITKPIEFEEKLLPLDPYLLGALIGDGGLAHQIRFSNNDPDIIEKVRSLLPSNMQLKKVQYYDYTIIKREGEKWSINPIYRIIKELKLNVKSEFKFIPEQYLFSSIEQKVKLLQGLMDTDGYISKKSDTIQYSTVSEKLCDDLIFLIQSLGGIAFKHSKIPEFTYRGAKKKGKKSYTITIRLPKGINPFYCERKRVLFVEKTKYLPARAIKKITLTEIKEATCIATTHKDRLYLTNDCIVTHNTIQSIAYLHAHPELRPAVIVVPATLKLDWKQKLEEWLTDPKIEMLRGGTPWSTTGDIIIINYDILPKWVTELKRRGPQIMIMDEVHYIKASPARRTKACKRLAKDIPHVIGLSGTPILNRPSEIYNAVRIINPEIFPVFDDFARRYCNRRYNGFGWDNSGSSNIHELHEILVNTIMIRRLKKDVLNDLPDKIYNFVPIELSNLEEYRFAENDLISFIRAEKGALAAIKAKSAEALVKIEVMKQLAAKGKLPQAIEWIRDFLESDGKLVLFATHKTIVQALADEFGSLAVRFDGSMTDVQKQKAKEQFQTNPEIRLFIGNIKAASEGITLTAASTVAFLEYPWSPGLLVQCADRCHRMGQKDNVTVHYLLAEGTIDEKIARLLDSKKTILSQMIDGVEVEQETLLTEIMKAYE